MKKAKKNLKFFFYNKKNVINFIKKQNNFLHVVKTENSPLFKCLSLAKRLIYRRLFKKMIIFFKSKKHLKNQMNYITNRKSRVIINSNSKKRKMTYNYKMFKFIKQQNYKKKQKKKRYLLGDYNFFYLFFLFKNLNLDNKKPLKEKIYNFLKINSNIIGIKSKLGENTSLKAFKFLFFSLKLLKKNKLKKKNLPQKRFFFKRRLTDKKLKKNWKNNNNLRSRYKKKKLFRKILKLKYIKRIKFKKSLRKKQFNSRGYIWLKKSLFIYYKRQRRKKRRYRRRQRRLKRQMRRYVYKNKKFFRRLQRFVCKHSKFVSAKKKFYWYFKRHKRRKIFNYFTICPSKLIYVFKKKKQKKIPYFFFFKINKWRSLRKLKKYKLYRLWRQNLGFKKKIIKKNFKLNKDFSLLTHTSKSKYDNKRLDYFNQMLQLFIKKLVLVKMRNGKKEKALKILTDCCFYLRKHSITLKKNISFLDFFKKIFFNLQPIMKKKYVYYGRRKELENSSLNNSRLDAQQLRLPINWIYESLSQDPRKMLSLRLFEELWIIYFSFEKSKTYFKKQEFYQSKLWKSKKS